MSRFRSLQSPLKSNEAQEVLAWPALYRDGFVTPRLSNDFVFQIGIEKQLSKTMDMKQLQALPSFLEIRNITSKSGWTYQGKWRGVFTQTLLSLFSTPNLYPWIKLESFTGQHCILDRKSFFNSRLIWECDQQPLPVSYGGPLALHCFDHYIEYAFWQVKRIVLMTGEHEDYHPMQALGFLPEEALIASGEYYALHQQQMMYVEQRTTS